MLILGNQSVRTNDAPARRSIRQHRPALTHATVIRDYRTQYANPIRFATGEIVMLGERDTEWPAFAWTTTADGNAGWAPFDWLKPLGDGRAEALRDYSARELDVVGGDGVVLHHELGGWWWCERADGQCGWVPAECMVCA